MIAICGLHNQLFHSNDFLDKELPQYVGVSSIDREMKDRFVYRIKNQKAKTSIQTSFNENCAY